MKPAEAKFDQKDPMVQFIIAYPSKTVVLLNDEEGRADKLQRAVFDRWCEYLAETNQEKRLKVWRFMRGGGSRAITLPCADPWEYEAFAKRLDRAA